MRRRKLDFDGDFDNFLPIKKGFHNTSGVVATAIQEKTITGIQPKVTGAVLNGGGVGTANPGALGGGVVRGGGQSVTSTSTSGATGGVTINPLRTGLVAAEAPKTGTMGTINTQGLIADAVKKELASNPIVVTNQPAYTSGVLAGLGLGGAMMGNASLGGGGFSGGGAGSPENLDEEIAGDNQRAALVQQPEKRNSLPFIFGGVVIIGLYLIFSKK